MRKQNFIVSILGLFFLFSPTLLAAESAKSVLTETKTLFKKADKLQGAWITTGKLIKKAEAALKKGDKAKSLKLAKKARLEARMSISQAEEQLKNWAEPSYIEH